MLPSLLIGKPLPFMPKFRDVICAVALRTFTGHYIGESMVKEICDDYYLITKALELVNFPIILPFTAAWYGKKIADLVLLEFAKCAAKSKIRMGAGGNVEYIMDAWVKNMNLQLRGGDRNVRYTPDMLDSMVYTRVVVKENLRYRTQ